MKRFMLLVVILASMVVWGILAGCGSNSLLMANAGEDQTVQLGDTVYLYGICVDSNGTITKYEWDFNSDGVFDWSNVTSGYTTYICNRAGTFTMVFRITDNTGRIAEDTCIIAVNAIPNVPVS